MLVFLRALERKKVRNVYLRVSHVVITRIPWMKCHMLPEPKTRNMKATNSAVTNGRNDNNKPRRDIAEL